MSNITQWVWAGLPDAGRGTLTMWPGTADELAMPMQSFEAAHALAEHLSNAMSRAEQTARAQAIAELRQAIESVR